MVAMVTAFLVPVFQHINVFLDKFHEKSPNIVAVAVFVAKIWVTEISAGTLYSPSPRVRQG